MGATVAGGALAGAFALFALAPGSPASLPPTQGNRGNTKRLPSLRLPITGPLAALGAVALWFPADTRRRLGLVFLVLWSLSVPVAMLASEFIDRPIKVFRVAGFALAIPILGAAALVGAVRLGRRYGTTGLVVGVLALVAGLAFSVGSSVDVYRMPAKEGESASKIDQVRAAGAYLETVPEDRPAVFLISIRNPFLVDRLVRAGLPPDRILHAHLYWGGFEDLLAKRPGAQGAEYTIGQDRKELVASLVARRRRDHGGRSRRLLPEHPQPGVGPAREGPRARPGCPGGRRAQRRRLGRRHRWARRGRRWSEPRSRCSCCWDSSAPDGRGGSCRSRVWSGWGSAPRSASRR